MFDQAEAHQLSKTVEQITTVDNVKHTLFKCCPFLRRIFAKTLSETLGQHPILCVKTTEGLAASSQLCGKLVSKRDRAVPPSLHLPRGVQERNGADGLSPSNPDRSESPCSDSQANRTEKYRLSQPGVETGLHLGMEAGGGCGHGKRAP